MKKYLGFVIVLVMFAMPLVSNALEFRGGEQPSVSKNEKKEYIKFANERMIEDLLPVLQSFDMAMGNKEAWEKADKNWRIGVEYIYSQLTKALSDNGLEEIKALGENFDHSLHDASSYETVVDKSMDNKDSKLKSGLLIDLLKAYEMIGKSYIESLPIELAVIGMTNQ
jgi:hypothetical protein